MKTLLFLFITFSMTQVYPAELSYLHSLDKTDHFSYQSKENNHTYHIYVNYPVNAEPNRRYPTVYLLDGGVTFPMFASYSHYLKFAEDIPELIIVGISYGTGDWENGNHRSNDYTAPSDEREFWGGASKFSDMLAKELFPMIENKYPSDQQQRIVFGQSLGGQYVIYSLMFRPELFSGYIASNPALHRNADFFMQKPARHLNSENIYIARARNDANQFIQAYERWISYWNNKGIPWKMKEQWFEGHNHFSIAPNAFRQGIMYLLGSGRE